MAFRKAPDYVDMVFGCRIVKVALLVEPMHSLSSLVISFTALSPIAFQLNQDLFGYEYRVVAGLSYQTECVAISITKELVHAASYYCIQGLEQICDYE